MLPRRVCSTFSYTKYVTAETVISLVPVQLHDVPRGRRFGADATIVCPDPVRSL